MTKIDIFSGFLGAGKTTLIKKLINEAYKGQKVVLIENEFGEIGIDGGFLQDAGVEITEMNSGCICCSLVGDFSKALQQVISQYSPDRILIEPSGVGKLSDVVKAVKDIDSADAVINSLTAVVDFNKCKMYMKNFGEFFNDQIENATSIVLSHTKGAGEEKLKVCIDAIREHNQRANIITTDWELLTGEQILDVIENKDTLKSELENLSEHHHHDCECGCHDHEHHHHADDVFTSWGVETANKYSAQQINDILLSLMNESKYGTILRAKGFVAGQNDEWVHFDYVPGEPDVRTGKAAVTGRICVIGSKINQEAIAKLFNV